MELLKKKSTRIALQIIILLLIAASVGLLVYYMVSHHGYVSLITRITYSLTLLCAAIYCLFGFKKNARLFYTLFMVMFIVTQGTSIVMMHNTLPFYGNYLCLAAFGCTCILAVAKDLGLTKSVIIAGIDAITSIAALVILICTKGFAGRAINEIAFVVMAIFMLLMVLAKYANKAERGTT